MTRRSNQEVIATIATTAWGQPSYPDDRTSYDYGFDNVYRYHVHGGGAVVVEHEVVLLGRDMPWLPRMAYRTYPHPYRYRLRLRLQPTDLNE